MPKYGMTPHYCLRGLPCFLTCVTHKPAGPDFTMCLGSGNNMRMLGRVKHDGERRAVRCLMGIDWPYSKLPVIQIGASGFRIGRDTEHATTLIRDAFGADV